MRRLPPRATLTYTLCPYTTRRLSGAGLAAADAAFGVTLAAMESTPDDIFLNGVVGHPEVLPDILAAARFDDLFRADRAFVLAIAGDKAGLGQNAALIFAKLISFMVSLASISRGKSSATV